MALEYEIFHNPGPEVLARVEKLETEIFDEPYSLDRHIQKLKPSSYSLCILVKNEQDDIGYKLGFSKGADTFYSYVGGVLNDFRGKGIARELMNLQHKVCVEKGYQYVQTKSYNKYKSMLILNLKNGFEIIGTQVKENSGEVQILFEKKLI